MSDNEKTHAQARLCDAAYLFADGFRNSRQHKEDEQELFAAAFAFSRAHALGLTRDILVQPPQPTEPAKEGR